MASDQQTEVDLDYQIKRALEQFIHLDYQRRVAYYQQKGNAWSEPYRLLYEWTKNKKYIRLYQPGQGVWAFVDGDGNIYKPDTWSRPAKHVRGNIYNDDPLQGTNVFGPNYLIST